MRAYEIITENSDKSHGSPYDCGGADSYYGRRFNPHKYVDLPNGNRQKVELTDPAEIAAYKAGYENEGGQGKDYGESVAEGANTLFAVKVIDPKTGNEKTMEISALTATEAKSKVAGRTVEVDGEKKHYKVVSVKSAWAEAANPAQQAAIAISMKKAGKKPKHKMKEDEEQSSYPTDAPIGTKYGSFRTPSGVKMNKFTGPEMVPDIRPARLGAPAARFPTDAPVGTKYGSFTDKDTGERMDKYVGPELTTHFQPASKGPWLPKANDTAAQGTPAHDESTFKTTESVKKGLYYNVNKRKEKGISRSKDNPKAPSEQDWKNAAKTAKK